MKLNWLRKQQQKTSIPLKNEMICKVVKSFDSFSLWKLFEVNGKQTKEMFNEFIIHTII